ncbi:DUF4230 domain-containing protein [uncultured Actinobacillus sp.]|uniref:DUF4230 domain-containing protein n=1 Tax=uncultured Actinobacillus sp. TaxID=417616 RepID=UPI0025CE6F0E|nr:DUF4230 domain-containing protein [uncultured Actinobacillus sp.]
MSFQFLKLAEGANHIAKAIKTLVITSILSFVGFWVYQHFNVENNNDESKITSMLIGKYLENAKELVSLKFYYKDVLMVEKNDSDWLPFNYKKLIISYEGMVVLGVDLKNLRIDVYDNKITIAHLGEPKIIAHDIKDDSFKVYDETARIFTSWSMKEFTEIRAKQRKVVEDDLMKSDFPEKTKAEAEKAIRELLQLIPGISGNYEIVFIKEPRPKTVEIPLINPAEKK